MADNEEPKKCCDCRAEPNYKTVNILGTEYKVFKGDYNKDPKLYSKAGYVDTTVKEIVINVVFEENKNRCKNIQKVIDDTLNHEIIHAFIYESGLDYSSDWAANEEMIDFFALQFNKISEAIQGIKL